MSKIMTDEEYRAMVESKLLEYRTILEGVSTITTVIDEKETFHVILSDVMWWQGVDGPVFQPRSKSDDLAFGCTWRPLVEYHAMKPLVEQIVGPYFGPNPILYNPVTKRFSQWRTDGWHRGEHIGDMV